MTLGAEENYSPDHEKKSVLNKVKAKAKKIKDTIKKHGQQVIDHGNGHNNEIQHTPDDVDLDEDKQLVQDPQDHQAPSMFFSTLLQLDYARIQGTTSTFHVYL